MTNQSNWEVRISPEQTSNLDPNRTESIVTLVHPSPVGYSTRRNLEGAQCLVDAGTTPFVQELHFLILQCRACADARSFPIELAELLGSPRDVFLAPTFVCSAYAGAAP